VLDVFGFFLLLGKETWGGAFLSTFSLLVHLLSSFVS